MPEPGPRRPDGAAAQSELFGPAPGLEVLLPEGFAYQPAFLAADEEAQLVALMSALPFEAARYRQYTARRRVVSYGGSFDYDANRLAPTAPLIPELQFLRARVAAWLKVSPGELVHALVAEYRPGTPLGWHRDVPDFEAIAGVSFGGDAVMRLRPYLPPAVGRAEARQRVVRMTVEARSVYALRGPARWQWQHSVLPTEGLRWSITFRTAARRAPR